jgi:hypothetical protein
LASSQRSAVGHYKTGHWNGVAEKNVLVREMPVDMDDHTFVERQDLFASRLESKLSSVGL